MLKAVAIGLVVFGHGVTLVYGAATAAPRALAAAYSVLSTLHVPLFVFVSGYLARPRADAPWLSARATRLVVPFLSWTLLQWAVLTRGGGLEWFLRVALHPTQSNAWFLLVLFELCALYAVLGGNRALLVGVALVGLLAPARMGDAFAFTYVSMLFPVFVAGRLAGERRFEPGWWVLPVAAVLLAAMWSGPGANMINASPPWAASLAGPTAAWPVAPVAVLVRVLRLALQLSLAGSAFFLLRRAQRGAWIGSLTLGVYCAHPFFLPLWMRGGGVLDVLAAFAISSAGGVGVTLLLARWRWSSVLLLGADSRAR